MQVLCKSINIVDFEEQQVIYRDTNNDFNKFVEDLTTNIRNNTSARSFKTLSSETEVINCILEICKNHNDFEFTKEKMTTIAKRLLREETSAQNKIQRTNTTVQKGSLIQVLLSDGDDTYRYILAKVEHTDWVDDNDFTFKTGFSKDKPDIWKSCIIDIDSFDYEEYYAKIYSNTNAQYWHNGFLELQEINTDESNTQNAFKYIDKALNRKFGKNKCFDQTVLRNNFIGYFRNHEYIDYDTMVKEIVGNYHPDDDSDEMKKKIKTLYTDLLGLPEKEGFDKQFLSIPKAIKARIKKTYHVNDGIELKVTDQIPNIGNTIKAYEENGVRYLQIRTNDESTYNEFKTKIYMPISSEK